MEPRQNSQNRSLQLSVRNELRQGHRSGRRWRNLMSSSENSTSLAQHADTDTNLELRKVRKGTRSCWECKRRKMKCSFSMPTDKACLPCKRRGSACISQKFPEDFDGIPPSTVGDEDRIMRVESLVQQLAHKVGMTKDLSKGNDCVVAEIMESNIDNNIVMSNDSSSTRWFKGSQATVSPSELESSNTLDRQPSSAQGRTTKEAMLMAKSFEVTHEVSHGESDSRLQQKSHNQLSATLHAALPPPRDVQLIVNSGVDISLHKLMSFPYPVLAQKTQDGCEKGDLATIPDPMAHPVLIARFMLIFANCLQYLHPEIHVNEIRQLSEPPRQMMRRLVNKATSTVNSNDDLLDCIEAIECIMLESLFEANSGHLRKAWFACRRGMLVAQMIGLHRADRCQSLKVLDPSVPVYPSFFWFRINCTDRQLSLMLGLPQGSLDVSMASEDALEGDTPEGRFERKQTAIAARILSRNESTNNGVLENLDILRDIDTELQRAADEMPSKWWLVPNLASLTGSPEKTFWGTIHLLDQMLYFNLLHMLHLPYLLRPPHLGRANFNHSRLASVSASRQLLTRFIMFRNCNRVAYSCRSIDFFALIAGMTLIIAHLDGHPQRRQRDEARVVETDLLSHQRNSDRAMIEQVLESMQGVAKLNTDVLSERASNLLRGLLEFETDAARGEFNHESLTAAGAMDDGRCFRISIPYFGTVRISREGAVSLEERASTSKSFSEEHSQPQPSSLGETIEPRPLDPMLSGESSHSEMTSNSLSIDGGIPSHVSSTISEAVRDEYLYPGLNAAVEDWTFQGVDMAFFDHLTRRLDTGDSDLNDGWQEWQGNA